MTTKIKRTELFKLRAFVINAVLNKDIASEYQKKFNRYHELVLRRHQFTGATHHIDLKTGAIKKIVMSNQQPS